MPETSKQQETLPQKLLFYTTAFFILLGTFSLFAFLFLVPFVIDPAFTTILMEFDTRPTECTTINVQSKRGTSNCSWTSCKEGCTKELYECTQIRVNYKIPKNASTTQDNEEDDDDDITYNRKMIEGEGNGGVEDNENRQVRMRGKRPRYERSLKIREYDYIEDLDNYIDEDEHDEDEEDEDEEEDDNDPRLPKPFPTGIIGNESDWYFTGAKLFPNVKGCGYPPMLNCTIFYRQYAIVGANFTCHYSRVDPSIVITDLDMTQVHLNLIYAMAIPIPSFIISIIYLTIAYFKIYNEDEVALVKAEGGEEGENEEAEATGESPIPPASGAVTPESDAFREDLASFGHDLKVAMADDISKESLDGISSSLSIQGNLNKMMTTSISTPPGPTAAV